MNSTTRIALACSVAFASPIGAAEQPIGAHRFSLPDGYSIELVVSPDLVPRPVSASFDPAGRLYVTDSGGSSKPPKEQWEDPHNRIVLVEDSDGDGRYEKSTVFADKIGFIQGCLWLDGSVYVAAPPSLWKFTDTDGDGVADKREEWFKQGVLTHCGNDIHGPYRGVDGWIYWTKGAFERLALTNSIGRPIQDRAAHIFRSRPDGSNLEAVMSGGMDNPVEVAFTPSGEVMFTSTFMDFSRPGTRDGLGHASYGSVFGKINDVNDELRRTGDIFLPMSHFGAGAPSGLCRYQGTALGDDFRDNLFATTFNLHKVTRHRLVPEGATFRTVDQDFVVSDNVDFHPTDVLEDADGSLLIVDTGGWYKLCCPSSQLAKADVLGGVYRVRRQGAHSVEDPRGSRLSWDGVPPGDLVRRLADPRPAVRERASDALVRVGASAVAWLDQFILQSKSAEARREAVWTLARLSGTRAREAVRQAMNDTEVEVRHAAIKTVSLWRDSKAAGRLLQALQASLRAGNEAQLAVVAEALGRIGHKPAVPLLLRAAERLPSDAVPDKTSDAVFTSAARYLEHSLAYALIEIADPVQTSAGLSSAHDAVRRVALIALDQMDQGGLAAETVAELLGSPRPVLRQTADWIARRHRDWGAALAGHFRSKLSGTPTTEEQGALVGQLALFTGNPPIQELLASCASDPRAPRSAREVALRAMAAAGLRETPAPWTAALIRLVQDDQILLLPAAIEAARGLPSPRENAAEWTRALRQVARHGVLTDEVRMSALAALPSGSVLDEPSFNFARNALDPAKPVAVRGSAVAALTRARLDLPQLETLAEALRTTGPLETTRLLGAFEGQTNEALGVKLIAALRLSKAASALRPDAIKPRFARYPESVQHAAEALISVINVDADKQRSHLDELLTAMPTGDVRRGQSIFNSTKAACSACHKIGYLGGMVGPDLTKIGEVRTPRDLLEAIVYPSASFVRSFESMTVSTRDGEEFTGVLKKDAPDEVILVLGPGSEKRLPRSEVLELRLASVSVMPQGLDEQLSRQELADLLAFLKNTKWGVN